LRYDALWVLEGGLAVLENSKSSGKRPREFTDAKRPEIALRDVALWVLEGGLAVLE